MSGFCNFIGMKSNTLKQTIHNGFYYVNITRFKQLTQFMLTFFISFDNFMDPYVAMNIFCSLDPHRMINYNILPCASEYHQTQLLYTKPCDLCVLKFLKNISELNNVKQQCQNSTKCV